MSKTLINKSGMLNVNAEKRRELSRQYGKVIDEVTFIPGGICCDIYLDKEDMVFTASIGESVERKKDGVQVRNWAYEQLKAISTLTWLPVISVLDVGESNSTKYQYNGLKLDLHEIKIDLNRFYVASLPNGEVRTVAWDVPVERRMTRQGGPNIWVGRNTPFQLDGGKVVPMHSGDTHILPYSEELWEGLQQLCKGIDELRSRLHLLIEDKEGVTKLIEVGRNFSRLLSAPAEENQE